MFESVGVRERWCSRALVDVRVDLWRSCRYMAFVSIYGVCVDLWRSLDTVTHSIDVLKHNASRQAIDTVDRLRHRPIRTP